MMIILMLMKKSLILTTLLFLWLSFSLPSQALTDAQVDAKVSEIRWLVRDIFSTPWYKDKYQYIFKEIFVSCAKTCKNELSKLASYKIADTYDDDFLGSRGSLYKLDSVVDWDTIKVIEQNWKKRTIRMIGLDAPESYETRYGYKECFWDEASDHLKSLLKNDKDVELYVQLELDASQWTKDKYDRLLAYVFYNSENLNKKMIEDGYWWEYTYNLPYKYQSDFKKAQKNAEKNNLGLWSENTCGWKRIANQTWSIE